MFISKKKIVFWGHTCPIFDWQNFTFWSKETRIKLLLVHDHWWGSKCLPKNIVRQAVLERLLQSKSPPSLFSRHNQDRTTEARADVCWTLASKREELSTQGKDILHWWPSVSPGRLWKQKFRLFQGGLGSLFFNLPSGMRLTVFLNLERVATDNLKHVRMRLSAVLFSDQCSKLYMFKPWNKIKG